MLEVIEKLLTLQERDRRIQQLEEELHRIPSERQELKAKADAARQLLDDAKHQVKLCEADRKKLELEAEEKQQLIQKYGLQQYQTKKNEEFRALAKEIETCKRAIRTIEDEELNVMERAEAAQKKAAAAAKEAEAANHTVESRLADLDQREQELQERLSRLESDRDQLASAVDEDVRRRYERLFDNKGNNVVVGIHRGVCGGCHMQLSRQTVVHCQSDQEIVTCINCSRILYYTPNMDVAISE